MGSSAVFRRPRDDDYWVSIQFILYFTVAMCSLYCMRWKFMCHGKFEDRSWNNCSFVDVHDLGGIVVYSMKEDFNYRQLQYLYLKLS
jgi:hypothetical protein